MDNFVLTKIFPDICTRNIPTDIRENAPFCGSASLPSPFSLAGTKYQNQTMVIRTHYDDDDDDGGEKVVSKGGLWQHRRSKELRLSSTLVATAPPTHYHDDDDDSDDDLKGQFDFLYWPIRTSNC